MELIRRIKIFRWPVKLKEPFVISLGKLEFADNVIVTIETSGGMIGFGECSPFLTIHGENGETCVSVGKILAKGLIGRNALEPANCSALMDSLIFGNASVKSAFDIAIHDVAARKKEMPLYRYLGGEKGKNIVTDYTVSLSDPEKMAADANKIIVNGFPVIKVKLGGSEGDDVLRMKRIRESVGYEIPLRIDANQGWNKESAVKILKQLEQFNIQHCEEPVPRHDFMSLPQIRKEVNIPLMADESCCDHHDAKRLISIGACDSFNIKLGKSSGFIKAIKIMRLAEKARMKIQLGGFLESRLGFTAAAHLACCSNMAEYFDFDTPLMLDDDPVSGGIKYGKKGLITLPDSTGLGATIPDDVLNSLESCEIV